MYKANVKTALKGLFLIVNIFLFGGCVDVNQNPSPTAISLENNATALSPQKVLHESTPTLSVGEQSECSTMEKVPLSDFKLDGTLILGNFADQSIHTFSTGDMNPQPLLGKDPSWNSNYHLSPDGKMLVDSILSDDGLRYTTLKIKTLNGDDIWEIPYDKDWSGVSGWINNEQIEMTKSDPAKSTTNPFTGTFAFNPFTKEISADLDATKLNLKPATIPYYDSTMTKVIYLRDDLVPEDGEPLFESIVVAELGSGKELWTREYPGRDLFLAVWSTDGKKVAIQDFSELIIVTPDNSLSKILQRDGLELSPSTFPVWSPDGNHIAVKTYESLAIYDPIKDFLTDLCVHDQVLNFSWSPNSRQLAVGGWLSDGSSYIFIIDIETKFVARYIGSDFVLLGWTVS